MVTLGGVAVRGGREGGWRGERKKSLQTTLREGGREGMEGEREREWGKMEAEGRARERGRGRGEEGEGKRERGRGRGEEGGET